MAKDEVHRLATPIGPEDHILGDRNAPVTLVEYGDYECPSCARAYPIIRELLQQLRGTVRLVYRHFPLTEIHPRARPAAEAAEAAGAQGRFWQMHNTLFEQHRLSDSDLRTHAAGLELELGRFEAELRAGAHLDRVKEDIRSGERSGVDSTPSFFINGLKFDGQWSLEALRLAIIAATHRDPLYPLGAV